MLSKKSFKQETKLPLQIMNKYQIDTLAIIPTPSFHKNCIKKLFNSKNDSKNIILTELRP